MDEFFAWMDREGFPCVVLRNAEEFVHGYPKPGSKKDVDCLIADASVKPIQARYGGIARRAGVKCDFYSVNPGLGADYLHHAYFPPALAHSVLQHRSRHPRGFFVPSPRDAFDTLAFHIAYHKAETSGFDYSDPAPARATKYFAELERLRSTLGLECEFNLSGLHQYLSGRGYAPEFGRLAAYVQNDFAHHRKGRFFAELFNVGPGELNLFVIRSAAVRHGAHLSITRWLRRHYRLVLLKRISFFGRAILSRRMRGNKWRRGGKPWIALCVFDPAPIATTAAERAVHPLVFNSKQFLKREIREWFVANHRVRPSINPIHSTDNEAEAIGHFPLFFTPDEQRRIFTRLARLRHRLDAPASARGHVASSTIAG